MKKYHSSMCQTPNKFVNDRPSGWTALSVASPQGCPLQRRYKLQTMKIILITLLVFSYSSFANEAKVFDLGNGIKVSILEEKFDPKSHKIENCENSNIPCRIDSHIPYGTAFNMPRTELKELKLTTESGTYKLDTTGMYNAWGERPLEYKGSIKYLGAYCFNPQNCTLRGIFSDAAGSYVAEWLILNGISTRTVLSSSDDIMHLFMTNIEPPRYD